MLLSLFHEVHRFLRKHSFSSKVRCTCPFGSTCRILIEFCLRPDVMLQNIGFESPVLLKPCLLPTCYKVLELRDENARDPGPASVGRKHLWTSAAARHAPNETSRDGSGSDGE